MATNACKENKTRAIACLISLQLMI